jgi:predicted Zn-dependent protease
MFATRNTRPDEALRLVEQEHQVRADLYTDDALAFALYRNGRIDDASRLLERWRGYGTNDARLLFHRGAIDMAAGRTGQGKRLLAAALARNPGFDVHGAAEARRLLEAK